MRLGLRQLRSFVAIADAGVLSHAARSLNVAQSALSHHISQLEDSLGVTLLERRARGVSLTASGQRLDEHAHLPRRLAQVWLRVRPKTRAFGEVGRILTGALDEAVRSGRWPAEPIRS